MEPAEHHRLRLDPGLDPPQLGEIGDPEPQAVFRRQAASLGEELQGLLVALQREAGETPVATRVGGGDAVELGEREEAPARAPVYGDFFKGFSPTLIQGGTRELYWAARRALKTATPCA